LKTTHNWIKKAVCTLTIAATCITGFSAHTGAVYAADDASSYKFADINLEVTVPNDLVAFTRNVTSNNAHLDRVGVDDVEELRSLMITNNIYLEAIPEKDTISYEILINGKTADSSAKDFNELTNDELQSQFEHYVAASDNIQNESVSETVTVSSIYSNGTTSYFVVDVTSVANNMVTTHVQKYYTVMLGTAITYTLQTNESAISSDMASKLQNIVDTAKYQKMKKSILDNQFVSEISATIVTLLIPICILALIVFFLQKSTKKSKKQIAADEARLRAQYAEEAKRAASEQPDKTSK